MRLMYRVQSSKGDLGWVAFAHCLAGVLREITPTLPRVGMKNPGASRRRTGVVNVILCSSSN